MSKLSSEELLIGYDLFEQRSSARRAVLDCIGCRWTSGLELGEKPTFQGDEAVQCVRISPESVYPLLARLAEAGVLESHVEELSRDSSECLPREIYRPSVTELGMLFSQIACNEQVTSCGLDSNHL